MAGDWIPMRLDLQRDPAVVAMAQALRKPVPMIVGGLHAVWSWWSEQSSDGTAPIGLRYMTAVSGVPGLGEQMVACGWLRVIDNNCLEVPGWDRWLGKSAKSRLMDARRKAVARGLSARRDVLSASASQPDTARTARGTTGQESTDTTASAARAAPRAAKDRPAGNHQLAVDHWCAEFLRTRRTPYAFAGDKDGAHVKALLRAGSIDTFRDRATRLLEHPDPFYSGADLGTLRSAWNKLAAPKAPTPSYARPTEPEPPGPGVPLEKRHAVMRAAIDAANGKHGGDGPAVAGGSSSL